MSILSEGMLAVTGVIRPKPDAETVGKADELLEQLRGRLRRWVSSTEVKPWASPSTHGFSTPEGLRDRLLHTPAEPEEAQNIGDDVLAVEWVAELTDARQTLLDAWPGVAMRGGLAAEEPPLSLDRTQDWLSLVAVVNDPGRLLSELEAGAVLPAQVAIMEAVYPELMRMLVEELFAGLVDLKVKKRELSPAKERTVRLLLGTEPDAPILVAEPEEPPPSKPSRTGDKQDTRTVAQKAGT